MRVKSSLATRYVILECSQPRSGVREPRLARRCVIQCHSTSRSPPWARESRIRTVSFIFYTADSVVASPPPPPREPNDATSGVKVSTSLKTVSPRREREVLVARCPRPSASTRDELEKKGKYTRVNNLESVAAVS